MAAGDEDGFLKLLVKSPGNRAEVINRDGTLGSGLGLTSEDSFDVVEFSEAVFERPAIVSGIE